jgi:hypothetical protein
MEHNPGDRVAHGFGEEKWNSQRSMFMPVSVYRQGERKPKREEFVRHVYPRKARPVG